MGRYARVKPGMRIDTSPVRTNNHLVMCHTGRVLVAVLTVLVMATGALAATPSRVPASLVPVDTAGSGTSRSAENALEGALEAPRVGERAPDFELPSMDGSTTMRLSAHRGARPVLLVFGSYT